RLCARRRDQVRPDRSRAAPLASAPRQGRPGGDRAAPRALPPFRASGAPPPRLARRVPRRVALQRPALRGAPAACLADHARRARRAHGAPRRDLGPRPTERRLGRRVGLARRRGPRARTLGLSLVPALAHAISVHAGHPAARGLDGHHPPDVPRTLPRACPRKLGAAVVAGRVGVWCRARGRGGGPALREAAAGGRRPPRPFRNYAESLTRVPVGTNRLLKKPPASWTGRAGPGSPERRL